ncbi:hypothetical protein PSTT_11476 [Puccinia striiformis]|uniref:Uncharacterized protein n=2 Tax=Puccinia striiformis TaxID=27350 RepID=A0A2S4V031_9BASI|nr:hypothetical protein PSTT_11476 [Puccinia striiformis]
MRRSLTRPSPLEQSINQSPITMARSSVSNTNNIQVSSSPAPSQSNTINLTNNDPDSPAPSTPDTSESQEATTSKKQELANGV